VEFTSRGIDNRNSLAGTIDKQLLTGPVFLPQGEIEARCPAVVAVAELAVLVAGRMALLVLLPQ
jgi:hypothetical protein